MFPESGGMVRYSHYSHGSLVGFIGAWANWIAIVSVIPIEAEASVQYMSGWDWQWAKDLYIKNPGGHGELTEGGLAIATPAQIKVGVDRVGSAGVFLLLQPVPEARRVFGVIFVELGEVIIVQPLVVRFLQPA